MKGIIGGVALLAIVVTACGDDEAELADCDAVADATIVLVQDVIDELESMTPTEQADLIDGVEFPAFVAIADRGDIIGARAQELECTDLNAMVAARADTLVADPANGFTQLIVQGTKDGEDVLARLFR